MLAGGAPTLGLGPLSGAGIGRLSGTGALWDCVPPVSVVVGAAGGGAPLGLRGVLALSWCVELHVTAVIGVLNECPNELRMLGAASTHSQVGLYKILPLPIYYCVWHTKAKSGGGVAYCVIVVQ